MKMRQEILNKTGGRCAYCGCELTLKTMQIDHIEPLRRGDAGDKSHLETKDNLNPSCRSCNYYKSTYTVDQFRNRMDLMIQNLERQSTVKTLARYGKVQFTRGPVVFWFEREEAAK